jgi:hypothetical protein
MYHRQLYYKKTKNFIKNNNNNNKINKNKDKSDDL